MFSGNNKISKRQMFRLLTYDLLGIGTLALPTALAETTEKNGLLAILFGIAAALAYCGLIGWVVGSMEEGESYPSYLKRCFGTFFGNAALLFYALYYLCLGGYAAYLFGHLIVAELLKEQSFYWIVAGILLLCVYGVSQGIEGRARIYEILFWFLMAPLFLMLFFASRDVELPRLFPLYTEHFEGVWMGAYESFLVFSIGGMALFLNPFAKKKQSIRGALICAVIFSGVTLLLLYGVLQGIFGAAAMRSLAYPAVTLMSMVQIPGGFLERQDALMVAIWFFTVFALLSSSLFYASENLKELTCGKLKRTWMAASAVILFVAAALCYRSAAVTGWVERAFLLVGTPLAVLVPLAAGCAGKKKRGKKMRCLLFLCCFLFLPGCSTAELENREFPLAMGIDRKEDGCVVSFKFEDLSAIADQNADSPGGTDFFIEDQDFFTAISKYANNTNKIMDYNHMKALILSKEFAKDPAALSDFLEICNKKNLLARSTLLFYAEDAAEILKLDENLGNAIGSYLEEMSESREDYRLKDTVTLGSLLNEMENKEQTLLIPELVDEGGIPVIGNYDAVSGGEFKGEVSVNDATLSYLSQGKLKKFMFVLPDALAVAGADPGIKGCPVTINRIVQKGRFSREDGDSYQCHIRLEAIVERTKSGTNSERAQIKNQIETLFSEQMKEASERLSEKGIDLTNSFYKRGMGGEELYERYVGDFEGYNKAVRRVFFVEAVLVDDKNGYGRYNKKDE